MAYYANNIIYDCLNHCQIEQKVAIDSLKPEEDMRMSKSEATDRQPMCDHYQIVENDY